VTVIALHPKGWRLYAKMSVECIGLAVSGGSVGGWRTGGNIDKGFPASKMGVSLEL
jgi:hypothetical protein